VQVLTVILLIDASMDSYWIDRCMHGYLLDRLIQLFTGSAYSDAGMGSYWIE